MRTLIRVVIMALTVFTCATFGQDDKGFLQQKLQDQFVFTRFAADRNDIVTAGTIVGLLKFGVEMYSTAAPLPPLNNYKNGKISLSFLRDLGSTILTPGKQTVRDYPHRVFRPAERLWVTGLAVQKDGVVITLFSDPYDNIRYYGQLRFPFEKNAIPTPDQALARIAEVIQKIDGPDVERVAGMYLMDGPSGNQLQLNADGTFSLVQAGRNYSGRFVLQGDKIMMQVGNGVTSGALQGGTLVDSMGSKWFKQGAPQVPASETADASLKPITPPPPPPDEQTAPPKTISIGQSRDEVIAILGQPLKVAQIGTKEILFYADLNVTLLNGKVADAQPAAKKELHKK